ncbi:MAG: ComEC/Rec2 family competence protein [Hyphomicrobiaceae bacterium]
MSATWPIVLLLGARWATGSGSSVVMMLTALLIIATGYGLAKLRTEWVRAPVLVQPIRHALITAYVERVEHRADHSQRLTLYVVEIKGLARKWTPKRVRIRLRKSNTALMAGQTIRITARLAGPPSPAQPRGYDFARAAFFKQIGGVGFALSAPALVQSEDPMPLDLRLKARLQALRRHIGTRIEQALPGETGIMANALMTGERSGISTKTNDLYRDAGIFHILSISGLHMAIMGGSVFVAIRFLFAAWPAIALRYPIKKWAALAAAVATFAYLLISGGAHPTVRSFIMILIMFLAIMLDRPAIALRNVGLAALLILCVMPESLFNAGFQLSFAAVVALVAIYEAHQARSRRRRRQGLQPPLSGYFHRTVHAIWIFMIGTAVTTIIAGLATAPLAAFHFHTSQQYSVLTNMLAIPVSNLIVMPAALAAFIAMPAQLEGWPLAVMGFGIELMTWSAEQVTALPGAVMPVPAFPEHALQLIVLGGLWLCIWRRRWRWLGIPIAGLGLVLATRGQYPDALIGKYGELVALRHETGRLAAIKARRATYEFSRWLEADGDARRPDAAWSRRPFRCDLNGCTGRIGRHLIAIPRSPAALVDDCRHADLLVISFPQPSGCRTTATVIDYEAMRRYGAHAVYLKVDQTMRIETVEQFRGHRPWTMAARALARNAQRVQRQAAASDHFRNDIASSSPPSAASQRPEIENDGHPLYWWP